MSCGKRKFDTESCVADILKRVADAQDEVDNDEGDCDVSCHRSIQDLLAGATTPTTFDTIPLILYCGCEPFLGTGVQLLQRTNGTTQTLRCIESFFFRVSKVDDNCAKLELLTTTEDPNGLSKCSDPCSQINGETTFFRTGICMTVDLDCFCAVVCLDPVATEDL